MVSPEGHRKEYMDMKKDIKEDFKGWMVYLIVSIIFMISIPFWMLDPPWMSFLGIGVFIITFAFIWTVLSKFGLRQKKKGLISIKSEKERFFEECESTINYYLGKNKGKAFTPQMLKMKLEEVIKTPDLLHYFHTNLDNILKEMTNNGTIEILQKDGKTHYFL